MERGMMREPGYTPAAQGVGIVHIGPGAFHRAHQAVYTDDVLAAAGGDWRILGVSLRSDDLARALAMQDGLYTLVVKSEKPTEYRRIGSLKGVLAASDGMEPIHAALADPGVRVVSLTVTEKAYVLPAPGDETPHAIGVIVEGLARRKAAGLPPFTVLSCDNLPDNGAVVRRAVLEMAGRRDMALADWIAAEGRFPSTMVDRITPRATDALRAEVEAATGFADRVPVVTEPFLQWVIEDNFACGRPAWEAAGALLVEDVAPYEKMKLRMLNGSHSMLAYAGFLSGRTYVRDVMADPDLSTLVARHIRAAAATLSPLQGVAFETYGEDLVKRFRNPSIAHETRQIAMDGSQKMPQRIFSPALDAAARGQDLSPFGFATAAWLAYTSGRKDDGSSYPLNDPREAELSALPRPPVERVAAAFALPGLVPETLAGNAAFRDAVVETLDSMVSRGMAAAIREAR
jgi:fructuronate reductase